MSKRIILAVNGYCAPADPANNRELTDYLNAVMDLCVRYSFKDIELHLLGGYTSSPSVTEAGAMKIWIDAHGQAQNVIRVVLHEHTTDLRGNCASMCFAAGPSDWIIYCCEYSRLPATRFMARRYLGPQVEVIGIPFDPKALSRRHRLLQRHPKLWVEWSAEVIGGPFEKLRVWLRQRHILKHRRLNASAP